LARPRASIEDETPALSVELLMIITTFLPPESFVFFDFSALLISVMIFFILLVLDSGKIAVPKNFLREPSSVY